MACTCTKKLQKDTWETLNSAVYVGREKGEQMGWPGNFSQLALLHCLISKYRSVLSLQIMKLKIDLQPTVGVKINTMQLNRHNTHLQQFKNESGKYDEGRLERFMWKSGVFRWSQAPKSTSPHTDIPIYTNEALAVYGIRVKGNIVPFLPWGGEAKFKVIPSLLSTVFLERALTTVYQGRWPRWQGAWKPWKMWGISDETRDAEIGEEL